jgi:uncharacterized protein YraI
MRKALYRLGLALMASLLTNLAQAACTVADPTGTPLNVRDAPNGAIIGTLPNGFLVEPLEERRLGAKKWIRVAVEGTPRGWVFGAYVICESDDADSLKSAPMHPRSAPN